jgi:hypothetical protein
MSIEDQNKKIDQTIKVRNFNFSELSKIVDLNIKLANARTDLISKRLKVAEQQVQLERSVEKLGAFKREQMLYQHYIKLQNQKIKNMHVDRRRCARALNIMKFMLRGKQPSPYKVGRFFWATDYMSMNFGTQFDNEQIEVEDSEYFSLIDSTVKTTTAFSTTYRDDWVLELRERKMFPMRLSPAYKHIFGHIGFYLDDATKKVSQLETTIEETHQNIIEISKGITK